MCVRNYDYVIMKECRMLYLASLKTEQKEASEEISSFRLPFA